MMPFRCDATPTVTSFRLLLYDVISAIKPQSVFSLCRRCHSGQGAAPCTPSCASQAHAKLNTVCASRIARPVAAIAIAVCRFITGMAIGVLVNAGVMAGKR